MRVSAWVSATMVEAEMINLRIYLQPSNIKENRDFSQRFHSQRKQSTTGQELKGRAGVKGEGYTGGKR